MNLNGGCLAARSSGAVEAAAAGTSGGGGPGSSLKHCRLLTNSSSDWMLNQLFQIVYYVFNYYFRLTLLLYSSKSGFELILYIYSDLLFFVQGAFSSTSSAIPKHWPHQQYCWAQPNFRKSWQEHLGTVRGLIPKWLAVSSNNVTYLIYDMPWHWHHSFTGWLRTLHWSCCPSHTQIASASWPCSPASQLSLARHQHNITRSN